MADIVETPKRLPSRMEASEMGLSLSEPELCDRFDLWDRSSTQGTPIIERAVMAFSIKKALENNHPFKSKIKAKDWNQSAKNTMALSASRGGELWKGIVSILQQFRRSVTQEMGRWFPQFLTPELRERAVKLHARGNSTVNVIKQILSPACKTPNVFYFWGQYPTADKRIIDWLTPRFAYLKLGSSSFPKKYMEMWQEERAAYLDEIKEMPLTETVEQVQALSDLYSRLDDAFNNAETDRGQSADFSVDGQGDERTLYAYT